MRKIAVVLSVVLMAGIASADIVSGFTDVTLDTSVAGEIIMTDLTWGWITYNSGQFIYGTTERYYNTTNGTTELWVNGSGVPADILAVSGTSTPKVGDTGDHADNNIWRTGGANNISSLDAIAYQETIFASPVDTIFVFERGGNDGGTVQAILVGGGLGTPFTLTAGGAPYANVSLLTGGSGEFGYVYESDIPIAGIQIAAPGHDAFTVVTIPEPTTLALLGLGGLLAIVRRRR